VVLINIASAKDMMALTVSPNPAYPGQQMTIHGVIKDPGAQNQIIKIEFYVADYTSYPGSTDPGEIYCISDTRAVVVDGEFTFPFHCPRPAEFMNNQIILTYRADGRDKCREIVTLNIVPKSEIPEFPSIALPAVALLGIMAVFGRRKKE
jgi:hypothetical protein